MKKSSKTVLNRLIVIVIGALTLSIAACRNQKSSAETKSLYAQGLEIVTLMSEMTQYADLYTNSQEVQSIFENVGAADYSTPKAVYAISIADAYFAAMAELINMNLASDELSSLFIQKALGSFMVQVNSRGGVENLTAASICTVEKTFVNEEANESVIYLYTYDHAAPAAVTFIVGEDHAISAKGVFVLYDQFTCGSADEINSFFEDIFVEVTEVFPEQ